ncbi:MAG TPA: hypothetical protein VKC15_01530 [Gemmatimonadales bacterium]|nr:hypothetical protein [Gemmatimonadales bacterium]
MFQAIPWLSCAALLVVGAIVPMPGMLQLAVSIGAFVLLFVGMWYQETREMGIHAGRPLFSGRQDLEARVARYRRMAWLPPVLLLAGVGGILGIIILLVRSGHDYPPRVGAPVLIAAVLLLYGAALLWDAWLIGGQSLHCPFCGASLAGWVGRSSITMKTLKTGRCSACRKHVIASTDH